MIHNVHQITLILLTSWACIRYTLQKENTYINMGLTNFGNVNGIDLTRCGFPCIWIAQPDAAQSSNGIDLALDDPLGCHAEPHPPLYAYNPMTSIDCHWLICGEFESTPRWGMV